MAPIYKEENRKAYAAREKKILKEEDISTVEKIEDYVKNLVDHKELNLEESMNTVEQIERLARAAKAAGCNWADLLHPVEDRSRELLDDMHLIYFNSGLHIRSAFTVEEAVEALKKLVAEYPVEAATTLAALRSGDVYLSRRYLELLVTGRQI